MSLSRIVLRLARNPGAEFAGGDDHRGYSLVAPLTTEGLLDVDAWHAVKTQCTVRRFAPDEEHADGRLSRRGQTWFFDYDNGGAENDEPVHRLGEHRFIIGEYVAVGDHNGRLLTYKVTDVAAV